MFEFSGDREVALHWNAGYRFDVMTGPPNAQLDAAATLAKVRAGLELGGAPIVSEVVRVIKEVSSRFDSMAVDELADLISHDPATMTRIISIASSLGYNPSGQEVRSVAQAVAAIGFERVRNLALSLLLLESTQSQTNSRTNRELAGLCLVSGLFSAEMARRPLPVEPDLAFVCGALRGYGRMLMAAFSPEQYVGAVQDTTPEETGRALKEAYGLSPIELGRKVLAELRLPKVMLDSMVAVRSPLLERAGREPRAALVAVADFGLRLAQVISSEDLTYRTIDERIHRLSMEYPKAFQLSTESARELVSSATETMEALCTKGGFSLRSVVLFRRLKCLQSHRPLPKPYRPQIEIPSSVPASPRDPGAASMPEAEVERSAGVLKQATARAQALAEARRFKAQDLLEFAGQTIRDALDLEGWVVFLKERQGQLLRVACGWGPISDQAQRQTLNPERADVFSVPLRRSEDVLIQDPDDPGIRPFVPEWLRQHPKSPSLLLLPLRNEQGVFALVCAVGAAPLPRDVAIELRRFRAEVSRLVERMNDGTPSQC